MCPLAYPRHPNGPRPHDIVLDIQPFCGRPFACVAAALPNHFGAGFFGPESLRADTVVQGFSPLGRYRLAVALHSHRERFVAWPDAQEVMVARELESGGSLLPLIIADMP